MASLKTLLSAATNEIEEERDAAAKNELKSALRRVENAQSALDDANDALEKLKASIEDGSFKSPSASLSGLNWVTYSN